MVALDRQARWKSLKSACEDISGILGKDPEEYRTSFVQKRRLSPDVFDSDGHMLPHVREKLLRVADDFWNTLEVPEGYSPEDVVVTGSVAGYGWNAFSDVDLDLVVDFASMSSDEKLARDYVAKAKQAWKASHDPSIAGFDVELYVMGTDDPNVSQGLYSVKDDEWVVEPSMDPSAVNYPAVVAKAAELASSIDDAVELMKSDPRAGISASHLVWKKLKKLRAAGLQAGGLRSTENLAFKLLRRSGYLKALEDAEREVYDASASVGVQGAGGAKTESRSSSKNLAFRVLRCNERSACAPKAAEEAVKGVKSRLTGHRLVVHFGKVGRFDVYAQSTAAGRFVDGKVSLDSVHEWADLLEELPEAGLDPSDVEELLAPNYDEWARAFGMADSAVSRLGVPGRPCTAVLVASKDTGASFLGTAQANSHVVEFNFEAQPDPGTVVHEWAHLLYKDLPRPAKDLVVSEYDSLVGSGSLGTAGSKRARDRRAAKAAVDQGVMPSEYASTDAEEMFCEVVAFLALSPERVSAKLRSMFVGALTGG